MSPQERLIRVNLLRGYGVDIQKLVQKLMADDVGRATKIIAKPILWRMGLEAS